MTRTRDPDLVPTPEEYRAAVAAARHRRQRNALVLLLDGGPMRIHRRNASHAIGRNRLGHAWITTLHELERRRLVERKRLTGFELSEQGRVAAMALAAERRVDP